MWVVVWLIAAKLKLYTPTTQVRQDTFDPVPRSPIPFNYWYYPFE